VLIEELLKNKSNDSLEIAEKGEQESLNGLDPSKASLSNLNHSNFQKKP
jgi:hypothetical protein